ncbi:hypothetical protein CTA1_3326 [Colletotrichum tanaceti]|uniref:Uncharacterized protein n=1 Tax=Colletotrichum tanaceti TaxID=1306861 RepID=A0A4U6XKH5_9PEZI|nr:hypothetical protein CTA1_3326 [Colletotrichum tanaceti]
MGCVAEEMMRVAQTSFHRCSSGTSGSPSAGTETFAGRLPQWSGRSVGRPFGRWLARYEPPRLEWSEF